MSTTPYDLAVIGAGPGGYVSAIRAAELGWRVAIIEKESVPGGTCLRVGCIPSKALLESSQRFASTQHDLEAHGIHADHVSFDLATMMQRKDKIVTTLGRGVESLFKKNKIDRFQGIGRFIDPNRIEVIDGDTPARTLEARNILIATGSLSAPLRGVEIDGDRIATSTEALSYPEVPEHLIVIGAGFIGLELGSVWKRLGARVTVLEYLDHILPGMDLEISKAALKEFQKQGLEFQLGTRVESAIEKDGRCRVATSGGAIYEGDRVLLAVGRSPNTEGLGLDRIGLKVDERGRIPVNDHNATALSHVFAIGDVVAGPMLAHKASDEGVACVERMITGYGHFDRGTIPGVAYTHPEIGAVGDTEETLTNAKTPYKTGKSHFRASGRARALGETEGFVKVLAHAETDRILGVHIIGPQAGELINEAATAMNFGASSEDLARVCHAHPTLAEALKEACLNV